MIHHYDPPKEILKGKKKKEIHQRDPPTRKWSVHQARKSMIHQARKSVIHQARKSMIHQARKSMKEKCDPPNKEKCDPPNMENKHEVPRNKKSREKERKGKKIRKDKRKEERKRSPVDTFPLYLIFLLLNCESGMSSSSRGAMCLLLRVTLSWLCKGESFFFLGRI